MEAAGGTAPAINRKDWAFNSELLSLGSGEELAGVSGLNPASFRPEEIANNA